MPKSSKSQTPSTVLQKYIDDYQTNPFALSKALNVAYQTVTHIIQGKARISVQMALRLAKHFGNSPKYWLDIQSASEIDELSANKKFVAEIKKISKADKSAGKAKKETKAKAKKGPKGKKGKKPAKAAGAKKTRGRKAKKK